MVLVERAGVLEPQEVQVVLVADHDVPVHRLPDKR
jgi:hypothetical protein